MVHDTVPELTSYLPYILTCDSYPPRLVEVKCPYSAKNSIKDVDQI